jgi:hypothetical protein
MYKVAMPLLSIKNILSDLFILHLLIAKKKGCPKEKRVRKWAIKAEAEEMY